MSEQAASPEPQASPILQGVAASRASTLDDAVREVHLAVLRHFVATGAAPDVDDLKSAASSAGIDTEDALAALRESDLVHVDEAGRVRVAYPFSGVPTPHTVRLASGVEVYSMCAIDAVGIPLMLGEDGLVRSSDPDSGQVIEVERREGAWRWAPEDAVVLVAWKDGCSSKAEGLCPSVAFYSDRAGAENHLAETPGLKGAVIGHDDAVKLSDRSFGSMLS